MGAFDSYYQGGQFTASGTQFTSMVSRNDAGNIDSVSVNHGNTG